MLPPYLKIIYRGVQGSCHWHPSPLCLYDAGRRRQSGCIGVYLHPLLPLAYCTLLTAYWTPLTAYHNPHCLTYPAHCPIMVAFNIYWALGKHLTGPPHTQLHSSPSHRPNDLITFVSETVHKAVGHLVGMGERDPQY